MTLMVQRALGDTLTVSEASSPARSGEVSETFRTAPATGLTGHGLAMFGIGWSAMLFETSAKVKALGPAPTARENVKNDACQPSGAGSVAYRNESSNESVTAEE